MDSTNARAVAVALVGCGGGAGASTTAAAVALAAARRGAVVALVDLDERGGGLDIVCGLERSDGVRWCDLIDAEGSIDGRALLDALPVAHGVGVLSQGRVPVCPSPDLCAAVWDALLGECDLLVFDAHHHLDPGRLPRDTHYVLVAHGDVRGAAAVGAVAGGLEAHDARVEVLVRDPIATLPRDLADATGCEVVGEVVTERRITGDLARGVMPGGRGELARLMDGLVPAWLSVAGVEAA